VIIETDETFVVEDVQIKAMLQEQYEFVSSEGEDYVRFSDISSYVKEKGIRLSDNKLGRELKKIGLKKMDKRVDGKTFTVYYGLKD
jgi:cell division GTPase FtsZ